MGRMVRKALPGMASRPSHHHRRSVTSDPGTLSAGRWPLRCMRCALRTTSACKLCAAVPCPRVRLRLSGPGRRASRAQGRTPSQRPRMNRVPSAHPVRRNTARPNLLIPSRLLVLAIIKRPATSQHTMHDARCAMHDAPGAAVRHPEHTTVRTRATAAVLSALFVGALAGCWPAGWPDSPLALDAPAALPSPAIVLTACCSPFPAPSVPASLTTVQLLTAHPRPGVLCP